MVTAVDASGNGNDGTYSGILGIAGRPGLVSGDASVNFGDGPNRVTNVLTPSMLDFTGPFTIACLWIPESSPAAYIADNGTFGMSFVLFPGAFFFFAGFQQWESVGFSPGAPGTAHLAAFSFDNTFPESTGVFYFDGAVVPNDVEPLFAIPAVTMTTAGINANIPDAVSGATVFDEWACWNRVLSGGEIASLQSARGSFAAYSAAVLALSPTAYYHFDELPILGGGWSVGTVGMAAS